jgi:hypothetical protein
VRQEESCIDNPDDAHEDDRQENSPLVAHVVARSRTGGGS